MQQIALLVALCATSGPYGGPAVQSNCAGGSCARAYTYQPAPMATYSRGYAGVAYAAPAPAAPTYAAPGYGYQPRAAAPVAQPQPTYQVAQYRPYAYQRYYQPAAASCPGGNCARVR